MRRSNKFLDKKIDVGIMEGATFTAILATMGTSLLTLSYVLPEDELKIPTPEMLFVCGLVEQVRGVDLYESGETARLELSVSFPSSSFEGGECNSDLDQRYHREGSSHPKKLLELKTKFLPQIKKGDTVYFDVDKRYAAVDTRGRNPKHWLNRTPTTGKLRRVTYPKN